jgi:hypothetical protein
MSTRAHLGIATAAFAAALTIAGLGAAAVPLASSSTPVSGVQLVAQVQPFSSGDYQRGYRQGYRQAFQDGHKDGRAACRKRSGHARVQGNNQGDFERGYGDGYARGYDSGFALGCRAARR